MSEYRISCIFRTAYSFRSWLSIPLYLHRNLNKIVAEFEYSWQNFKVSRTVQVTYNFGPLHRCRRKFQLSHISAYSCQYFLYQNFFTAGWQQAVHKSPTEAANSSAYPGDDDDAHSSFSTEQEFIATQTDNEKVNISFFLSWSNPNLSELHQRMVSD